jgi:hypothetical protein
MLKYKIKKDVMNGYVACMEDMRNVYKILYGKLDRKHLGDLGVDGRILLKLILKEIGCARVGWIKPAQDRIQLWDFENTAINLRVLYKVGNYLTRPPSITF